MSAVDKQALLRRLEDQVERHIALAVKKYQNLPEELLTVKPKDGGWSVSECLWHLNSYGNHYLPRIEDALKRGGKPADTFTSTWMGAWFTRMMEPGTNKRKLKAFKDHVPPAGFDSRVVVEEFIRQQEWLQRLLRQSQLANLNRIRIGLSILPWVKMRLGDVFQFLIVHQERHLAQAERVLEETV